jgi:hypothetical protein
MGQHATGTHKGYFELWRWKEFGVVAESKENLRLYLKNMQ